MQNKLKAFTPDRLTILRFLRDVNPEIAGVNGIIYLQYLLCFKLWRSVTIDKARQNKISTLADKKLNIPTEMKKNIESDLKTFGNLLPKVKGEFISVRLFMDLDLAVLEKVKMYFKHLPAIKNEVKNYGHSTCNDHYNVDLTNEDDISIEVTICLDWFEKGENRSYFSGLLEPTETKKKRSDLYCNSSNNNIENVVSRPDVLSSLDSNSNNQHIKSSKDNVPTNSFHQNLERSDCERIIPSFDDSLICDIGQTNPSCDNILDSCSVISLKDDNINCEGDNGSINNLYDIPDILPNGALPSPTSDNLDLDWINEINDCIRDTNLPVPQNLLPEEEPLKKPQPTSTTLTEQDSIVHGEQFPSCHNSMAQSQLIFRSDQNCLKNIMHTNEKQPDSTDIKDPDFCSGIPNLSYQTIPSTSNTSTTKSTHNKNEQNAHSIKNILNKNKSSEFNMTHSINCGNSGNVDKFNIDSLMKLMSNQNLTVTAKSGIYTHKIPPLESYLHLEEDPTSAHQIYIHPINLDNKTTRFELLNSVGNKYKNFNRKSINGSSNRQNQNSLLLSNKGFGPTIEQAVSQKSKPINRRIINRFINSSTKKDSPAVLNKGLELNIEQAISKHKRVNHMKIAKPVLDFIEKLKYEKNTLFKHLRMPRQPPETQLSINNDLYLDIKFPLMLASYFLKNIIINEKLFVLFVPPEQIRSPLCPIDLRIDQPTLSPSCSAVYDNKQNKLDLHCFEKFIPILDGLKYFSELKNKFVFNLSYRKKNINKIVRSLCQFTLNGLCCINVGPHHIETIQRDQAIFLTQKIFLKEHIEESLSYLDSARCRASIPNCCNCMTCIANTIIILYNSHIIYELHILYIVAKSIAEKGALVRETDSPEEFLILPNNTNSTNNFSNESSSQKKIATIQNQIVLPDTICNLTSKTDPPQSISVEPIAPNKYKRGWEHIQKPTLPLKKRREMAMSMRGNNGEVSYPSTPMLSIADLQAENSTIVNRNNMLGRTISHPSSLQTNQFAGLSRATKNNESDHITRSHDEEIYSPNQLHKLKDDIHRQFMVNIRNFFYPNDETILSGYTVNHTNQIVSLSPKRAGCQPRTTSAIRNAIYYTGPFVSKIIK